MHKIKIIKPLSFILISCELKSDLIFIFKLPKRLKNIVCYNAQMNLKMILNLIINDGVYSIEIYKSSE